MKTMKLHSTLIFLATFSIFIALIIPPSAARKTHVINFRSRNLFPESFAWDPKSQHFIVGSTRRQKIISVSDAGVVENLIYDTNLPVNSSFLGLAVDRRNNRLLACIHRVPSLEDPSPFNALAAYDLQSRRRLFLAHLPDENPNAAVANDVDVDFSGNAYVINSGGDSIWKVDINGGVSVLSKSKAYISHPVDVSTEYRKCGLSGVIYCSNGYLLVIQSNTGKMFKVNADDGTARTVTLNRVLTAADGVAVRRDGVVLVVSRDKLYFIRSNDGWGEGVVFDETTLEVEKSPTAVTVRDQKRVYVLYGHVEEGMMGNARRGGFTIVEVESEEENKEDNVWLYALVGLGFVYFLCWRFQMRRIVENMNKKTD